ncbi:MAG: HTTM domain-containing protein [Egibacteraceae bacterium]
MTTVGRWWFAPAPPTRLGIMRILVSGYSLWYLGRRYRMLLRTARADPRLFQPVGVARVLDRPLPAGAVKATLLATYTANVAVLLGWQHRFTGPAYSGLLLWVLTYRNSWSMIYHSGNLPVFHAFVIGVTPAADALSLDGLRRPTPAAPSWRYGWPLQLINTVTTATYWLAGVAKVAGPLGWGWAGGEALRSQVLADGLRKELLGDGAAPLVSALHGRPGLWRAMAVGSLAAELGAPLALPSRRLAKLWALVAFGMHWGIHAIMRIKFRYQMSGVTFAPFFELDRLPALLRRLAGRQAIDK